MVWVRIWARFLVGVGRSCSLWVEGRGGVKVFAGVTGVSCARIRARCPLHPAGQLALQAGSATHLEPLLLVAMAHCGPRDLFSMDGGRAGEVADVRWAGKGGQQARKLEATGHSPGGPFPRFRNTLSASCFVFDMWRQSGEL